MKYSSLLSLNKVDGDKCQISLDDVKNSGEASWNYHLNVSSQNYSVSKIVEMNFDEKELADFGHYVLSRLRGNFIVEHKIEDPFKE